LKQGILRYFSALVILTAVFGIFTNFAYAQNDAVDPDAKGNCPSGYIKIGAPAPGQKACLPKQTAFPQYINMIYTLSITLSIILATIMIIYGGYKYMTSSGNPETLAEAKDIITGAIVGLVLLVLAALILRTISPSIVGGNNQQNTTSTQNQTNTSTQPPPLEETTPSSPEGRSGGFSGGGGVGGGGGGGSAK